MFKNIVLLSAFIFLMSSCQKVIQVDLNNAAPAYVIEANLYEGTNDFIVKVTKTTSYFGTDNPPVVNDAVITLLDENQVAYSIPFIGNGMYQFNNFTANQNKTYQLNVNVSGKTFIARSTIPLHTEIDSLSFIEFAGFGGNDKGQYLMFTHFQDTVGIKNYYRILISRNDTVQNKAADFYLFDDKIRDGQYIDAPLFTTFFKMNDTADITLMGMDAQVYSYLTTLNDMLNSDANTSAAPANPNTNFSNGALGYFGAFTRSKKSIRIK